MDFTKKNLPQSEIELTVTLTAEEMKPYFAHAFRELSGTLNLKGFRSGKIPADIARQHISSNAILKGASQHAVEETYVKLILDNSIETVGSPTVEVTKIAEGDECVYKARVAVLPGLTFPDLKKIQVEKRDSTVEDAEVGTALKTLRRSRASMTFVDRPVAMGDQVHVTFSSAHKGIAVEHGSAEDYPLILGEGRLVPGFEDNLVGMKSGEEKDFTLRFPDTYYKKDLAGEDVDFHVHVKSVFAIELPELSDEFAKNVGSFESLEGLTKSVTEGLRMEKEEREKDRRRQEMLEKIADRIKTEIPRVLYERELDKMVAELKESVSHMGLSFEEYLKSIGKSVEELRSGWEELAERRIKSALVLREVARENEVAATEDEVEERINRDILRGVTSKKDLNKNFDLEGARDYIRTVIKNEKALEILEKKILG